MSILTRLRSIYARPAELSGGAGPAQIETQPDCIPSMMGRPWRMHFTEDSAHPPPGLEDGDRLTITSQVPNLDTDAISGVVTDHAGNQYPLNGQIDEVAEVTFFVTSGGGGVYFFQGTAQFVAEEMSMEGRFRQVIFGDDDEEGNWSAQAQGGGQEEVDRPYKARAAAAASR